MSCPTSLASGPCWPPPEGKQAILEKVIHGEQWEKFLARKYVGTKRFGLDGGESAALVAP